MFYRLCLGFPINNLTGARSKKRRNQYQHLIGAFASCDRRRYDSDEKICDYFHQHYDWLSAGQFSSCKEVYYGWYELYAANGD